MPEKRPTSILEVINTVANVAIALGVIIALRAYWLSERNARFDETLKLIDLNPPLSYAEATDLSKDLFEYFPDRWQFPLKTALSKEKAVAYFKIAAHPEESLYKEYNAARRHLNRLVPISFAYVHGIGDPKALADSECVALMRSYMYFEKLIDEFKGYGQYQSWQVIRQAARQMSADYPEPCAEK